MGEGYGGIRGKKRQGGRMTKGVRGDGEHEVGLDRTIGPQVTFELSEGQAIDLWKKTHWRNLVFFCQRMKQI